MKFHCILPVRDEADIIGQCLENLLLWADAIYVYDTGSVDGTWEIIQEVAAQDQRVLLLGREDVYFNDTLVRGWMFEQARKNMRDGDWFLRVDADEFHHVPPPEFVKTRLRRNESIVYHQYYDFALRESEVVNWSPEERSLPIAERRRWYRPSVYAEPRLCRYRESMRWPSHVSFPYNAGYLAIERLPIRHYPHRDPEQLASRCKLRAEMMADVVNRSNWAQPENHHWVEHEWRRFVQPDEVPGLLYWEPSSSLPEVKQVNHLSGSLKRTAQRLFYRSGLVVLLDHFREGWVAGTRPRRIQG
jgi:glycosyltransferase involved in cell wall biosynthesis